MSKSESEHQGYIFESRAALGKKLGRLSRTSTILGLLGGLRLTRDCQHAIEMASLMSTVAAC
jgi:hypothetical protein